jgi:E3 ubiquitin-protein ligase UBR7
VKGKARDTVGRWAGAPDSGFMVVNDDGEVIGRLPDSAICEPATGEKRGAADEEEQGEPESKRQRVDGDSGPSDEVKAWEGSSRETADPTPKCTAPKSSLVDSIVSPSVFLAEGCRTRWCRCPDCTVTFSTLPFLLEEAALYEPPADNQVPRSVFDPIDMEVLNRLPRVQVIEGLLAWNGMKCVWVLPVCGCSPRS